MSKAPDTETSDQPRSDADGGRLVLKARFHRKRKGCGVAIRPGRPPEPVPPVRWPARLAIQLALAHKIEQAILEGTLQDRSDAARRLRLSRARVSQICDLTFLPVAEQEGILFLEAVDGREPMTERRLRCGRTSSGFGIAFD